MTRSNDFSQNSAGPIGTKYTTPDGHRFAPACFVSFPKEDPIKTADDLFAAMFS